MPHLKRKKTLLVSKASVCDTQFLCKIISVFSFSGFTDHVHGIREGNIFSRVYDSLLKGGPYSMIHWDMLEGDLIPISGRTPSSKKDQIDQERVPSGHHPALACHTPPVGQVWDPAHPCPATTCSLPRWYRSAVNGRLSCSCCFFRYHCRAYNTTTSLFLKFQKNA